MKKRTGSYLLMSVVAASAWLCNGDLAPTSAGFLTATAEARIGRPATPVSYAGVARRTTARHVARPGVGAGGVGGPASGVGVLPGAGAGRAGVGPNAGGPVNRVGIR